MKPQRTKMSVRSQSPIVSHQNMVRFGFYAICYLAMFNLIFIGSGCKKDEQIKPEISETALSVSIAESKAYFAQNHTPLTSRSLVNQNDWQELELVWSAATEVNLADLSTIVMVPVADSSIIVNSFLDAYFVFYEDSISLIKMNALIFQADSSSYPVDSFPTMANFTGLIWEFDFELDSIGVFKVENGWVIDCGCSNTFMEFAQDVNSGAIQIRTDEPECEDKGWLGEIWSGIGGPFVSFGAFVGRTWDGIVKYFSIPTVGYLFNKPVISMGFKSSGTGAGSFGFGNGSQGSGGGAGGGTTGGGSGSSFNLSDYFSEQEIKQMQKAAIWMNATYGIELTTTEVLLALGKDCIFELMTLLSNQNTPSIFEDESLGPQCIQDYTIQWILDMFPHLTENDEIEIQFLLFNPIDREKWASYTSGDEARTENMKGYIGLKILNSQYNPDRFIELFNLLEDNPNALLSDCFSESDEYDLTFWNSLATYNPPQSVHTRIQELGEGWLLQSFITPTIAPRVNLDYFAINISLMPFKNEQTGERWTPADFFEYFRKNINLFVDTEASEFTPYRYPEIEFDYNLWNSTNPITSVISIEIPADDGSVICSKSEANNWIFSTLKAPFFPLNEDGFHPVSGNRQFGYLVDANQNITLYIKGADRYFYPPFPDAGSTIIAYLTEKIAFVGADALWRSFQSKTSTYINSHGGSAMVIPPVKNRPKAASALKQLLTNNVSISSQNLCGN